MSRRKEILIIFMIALALFPISLLRDSKCISVSALNERPTYHYRYWCNITIELLDNLSPADVPGMNELMLFPNTSRQSIIIEEIKYVVNGVEIPIKHFRVDEDGNPIIVFNYLPTYLSRGTIINVYFSVLIIKEPVGIIEYEAWSALYNASLSDIPLHLVETYAANKTTWIIPSDIGRLSKELAGETTKILDVLNNFSRWIEDAIAYPLTRKVKDRVGPQYPNETYELKIGDCDDSSILFITMCRAVGIPAFLQLGCIPLSAYEEEVAMHGGNYVYKSKGIGWHAWSMIYVPQLGWVPLDLTYFMGASIFPADEMLVYIKSPLGVELKMRYSAYFITNPIIYANFSTLRYVYDVRAWENAVAAGKVKYICEEELKVLSMMTPGEVFIPWGVLALLGIITISLLLSMYFVLKRKKFAKKA
ncbi:MAG: transglutaminase-like domain-containing protein [Nitrososphaerota archaeon]|nr:transglutaminase-like domain-containing protein [Candidatus Nezhaarchaeota archaeon]MDW8050183.1 transglutaminase-like domain-containing protein [Nitrososphaerota archaeon]